MAYASTGKIEDAQKDLDSLSAALKSLPEGAMYSPLNAAAPVLGIAENVAAARISMAKNDKRQAIARLRKAVELEDSLNYDEPEDWFIPVRETLGAALLSNKDFAEAETVFRAELKKHFRNGRALFGLVEALKGQGKTTAAEFVQAELQAAWKNADSKLRIEDL